MYTDYNSNILNLRRASNFLNKKRVGDSLDVLYENAKICYEGPSIETPRAVTPKRAPTLEFIDALDQGRRAQWLKLYKDVAEIKDIKPAVADEEPLKVFFAHETIETILKTLESDPTCQFFRPNVQNVVGPVHDPGYVEPKVAPAFAQSDVAVGVELTRIFESVSLYMAGLMDKVINDDAYRNKLSTNNALANICLPYSSINFKTEILEACDVFSRIQSKIDFKPMQRAKWVHKPEYYVEKTTSLTGDYELEILNVKREPHVPNNATPDFEPFELLDKTELAASSLEGITKIHESLRALKEACDKNLSEAKKPVLQLQTTKDSFFSEALFLAEQIPEEQRTKMEIFSKYYRELRSNKQTTLLNRINEMIALKVKKGGSHVYEYILGFLGLQPLGNSKLGAFDGSDASRIFMLNDFLVSADDVDFGLKGQELLKREKEPYIVRKVVDKGELDPADGLIDFKKKNILDLIDRAYKEALDLLQKSKKQIDAFSEELKLVINLKILHTDTEQIGRSPQLLMLRKVRRFIEYIHSVVNVALGNVENSELPASFHINFNGNYHTPYTSITTSNNRLFPQKFIDYLTSINAIGATGTQTTLPLLEIFANSYKRNIAPEDDFDMASVKDTMSASMWNFIRDPEAELIYLEDMKSKYKLDIKNAKNVYQKAFDNFQKLKDKGFVQNFDVGILRRDLKLEFVATPQTSLWQKNKVQVATEIFNLFVKNLNAQSLHQANNPQMSVEFHAFENTVYDWNAVSADFNDAERDELINQVLHVVETSLPSAIRRLRAFSTPFKELDSYFAAVVLFQRKIVKEDVMFAVRKAEAKIDKVHAEFGLGLYALNLPRCVSVVHEIQKVIIKDFIVVFGLVKNITSSSSNTEPMNMTVFRAALLDAETQQNAKDVELINWFTTWPRVPNVFANIFGNMGQELVKTHKKVIIAILTLLKELECFAFTPSTLYERFANQNENIMQIRGTRSDWTYRLPRLEKEASLLKSASELVKNSLVATIPGKNTFSSLQEWFLDNIRRAESLLFTLLNPFTPIEEEENLNDKEDRLLLNRLRDKIKSMFMGEIELRQVEEPQEKIINISEAETVPFDLSQVTGAFSVLVFLTVVRVPKESIPEIRKRLEIFDDKWKLRDKVNFPKDHQYVVDAFSIQWGFISYSINLLSYIMALQAELTKFLGFMKTFTKTPINYRIPGPLAVVKQGAPILIYDLYSQLCFEFAKMARPDVKIVLGTPWNIGFDKPIDYVKFAYNAYKRIYFNIYFLGQKTDVYKPTAWEKVPKSEYDTRVRLKGMPGKLSKKMLAKALLFNDVEDPIRWYDGMGIFSLIDSLKDLEGKNSELLIMRLTNAEKYNGYFFRLVNNKLLFISDKNTVEVVEDLFNFMKRFDKYVEITAVGVLSPTSVNIRGMSDFLLGRKFVTLFTLLAENVEASLAGSKEPLK